MEAKDHRPKRAKDHVQDWVTSFDRDLIRACQQKLTVVFEMLDLEDPLAGIPLVVDQGHVKFEIDGVQEWFNKSMISRIKVAR